MLCRMAAADEQGGSSLSEQDLLAVELTQWFKTSFFSWVRSSADDALQHAFLHSCRQALSDTPDQLAADGHTQMHVLSRGNR
jgi:hypothetical protein